MSEGPVFRTSAGGSRRYSVTHVKGGSNIHRVTRAPVHQIDEGSRPSYTDATGMFSFNKVGPSITSEFLSDHQRA